MANHRSPVNRRVFWGNEEPPLTDLLADPLLHQMMAGDGVDMDCLLRLITRLRGRLA